MWEMISILMLVAGIFVLGGVFYFARKPALAKESETVNYNYDGVEDWPFFAKKVMTERELKFYRALVEGLDGFLIFPQVSLSSFLVVKQTKMRNGWFGKIARKNIDFLVCNTDGRIVLAIELDDSFHDNENQKKRDMVKERAIKSAGLRFFRTRDISDAKEVMVILGVSVGDESSLQ